MQKILGAGCLLFAPLLFAQLDSNSVTVTASSTGSLQPDEVVFSIQVTSGLSASLDDVVAALQPIGITAANFTGVNGQFVLVKGQQPQPVAWSFSLAAPIVKMTNTVAQLTRLQQTIANQNNGLQMSFSVQGTQISQQLQQSQPCVLSNLLANARTQAQNLATAAGFTLDVILAMSSTITTAISGPATGLSSFLLGAASSPCTVTVKFALVRNQ